jgi:hypothetical protein
MLTEIAITLNNRISLICIQISKKYSPFLSVEIKKDFNK